MSTDNGAVGRYHAAPVGQEPGEIWFAVFLGDQMVSAGVMRQDAAEAEADRMNAAAANPQPPADSPDIR
jgi:hypothetical protein